jgi:hypothetical protein
MPFPNFHAARVKNPDLFDNIVVLKTFPNGIMIYGGKLKGETSTTEQSYRFPKSKFSVEEAKQWLKDHDITIITFEKASEKTQAFVTLQCKQLQAYSQDDILNILPKNILDEIKQKDSHPFFQMYSICHEGISSPRIIGEKSKRIHWTRKAIQSIKNIVLKGVKLFAGHNKDNSHNNRDKKGEIIHNFEKEIDGKLHHIAITYHNSDVRDEVKNYDICSQEAEWNFFEEAGQLFADTICKMTGIALGNSKMEKPAFSNAKRLGFVQAFEYNKEGVNMANENSTGDVQLKFEDWIKMKEKFNVYPWQMFTEEELKSDRQFGKHFDELERLRQENESLKLTKQEETEKLTQELKSLQKQIGLETAKERLKKIYDSQGATDKMKTFIDKSYDLNKEKLEDLSDEALSKFVQDQTKTFQNVMSIVEPETPKQQESGDNKSTESDDVSKADNNEFLDEDLDPEIFGNMEE